MSNPLISMLSDHTLEELLINHQGFAAIAFLAFDSIPCEKFQPELDGAADKLVEWIRFWKLETEENPTVCVNLNVTVVPSVLIFRDGMEVMRFEGHYCEESLVDRIKHEVRRKP